MSAQRASGVVIHSAALVSGGRITHDAWVLMRDGRVAGTGTGDAWRALVAAGDEVVDAQRMAGTGAVLAPGFVDLHGHGGGGATYADGAAAIAAVRAAHRAHGTTRAVVSLVSAPVADLVRILEVVADATGRDGVLGAHLEGPFLAASHRGAHDPAALCDPTPAAVDALVEGRPPGEACASSRSHPSVPGPSPRYRASSRRG